MRFFLVFCVMFATDLAAEDRQYTLKWKVSTDVGTADDNHVWDFCCVSHDRSAVLAIEKTVASNSTVKQLVLKEFSLDSGKLLKEAAVLFGERLNTYSAPRPGTVSCVVPHADGTITIVASVEGPNHNAIYKLDSKRKLDSSVPLNGQLKVAKFKKSLVSSDSITLVGESGNEAVAVKLSFDGKVLFSRSYGKEGRSCSFTDLIALKDDAGFLFSGHSRVPNKFGLGPSDVWLAEVDSKGNVRRETLFPGRMPRLAGQSAGGRVAVLYDISSGWHAQNHIRVIESGGDVVSDAAIKIGSYSPIYVPSLALLTGETFVVSGDARLYEYNMQGMEVGVLGGKLVLPFHESVATVNGSAILVLGTTIDDEKPARGNLYLVAP